MNNPTDTTAADSTVDDAAEQTPLADQLNALAIKAAVANRNKANAVEADLVATREVVKALRRNGTTSAVSPLRPDLEIAQVNVSKLTYSAKVTHQFAVDEWVLEKYPEKAEKKVRVRPGKEEALLRFLQDNAPYFIETVEVVPDHVVQDLLSKSKFAHEPMGFNGELGESAPPGIQVDPVSPKVTITPRNIGLIDDLILQGVIDHEGNMLVPSVEPVAEALDALDAAAADMSEATVPDQATAAPAPVFLSVVGGGA